MGTPGAGRVENENLPATWKGWDDTGRPLSFEEWPLYRVLRCERFQNQTLRAMRVETGQEFYASYNGCPIVDANGRLTFGFITIREITEQRRAEMALRESEERLRLALTATELGTWDYDPVTGALVWDARCKELFGLPPEIEVNYDMFLAGLHPDDRERANQVVQRTFDPASDGLFDIEYRTVGLRDGGVVRWVHATGRASFNTAGQAIRFIGTVQDITGRKRAEEALRLTQASVDGAAEMVAWFTPDGRIHYANDATCRTLGYSREELVRMSALDFSPGFTWEQYHQHWEEVRKRKSFTLEVTHRRKDGAEYPAEVLVNHVVYGGQEYIFAYGRDITERKRAETALRASEASLKRSQEIAHLGSWELDLASNRLTWSDEVYRIFGLQPKEFDATYQAFLERVHPDDRTAVDAAYSGSVRDGRESYEIEHRVVRKERAKSVTSARNASTCATPRGASRSRRAWCKMSPSASGPRRRWPRAKIGSAPCSNPRRRAWWPSMRRDGSSWSTRGPRIYSDTAATN